MNCQRQLVISKTVIIRPAWLTAFVCSTVAERRRHFYHHRLLMPAFHCHQRLSVELSTMMAVVAKARGSSVVMPS